MVERRWWRSAILLTTTLLSACGGGGGGGSPAPQPPPPSGPEPSPAPDPTPEPIPPETFDTAEYRRNWGLARIDPIPAYSNYATGSGVTVGVIDSGIDTGNTEFAGRIHAASRDVADTRTIQDEYGHGTWVAAIIGAARDNAGMHGVAYESTLLVARADSPGSCADGDCSFPDTAIAAGLDLARANDARVVNISLGGAGTSLQLNDAVSRTTAEGTIIVLSAGNEGQSDPGDMAQIARSSAARGLVIIAGSVDENNVISDFSNRAGIARDVFVVAPGERIYVPDIGGQPVLVSGTSAAAPHVTGAIALLADAFPNLSAADLVDLLYRTTTDLGAPGIDAVYGRGLINIGRAFEPQGETSLAGSDAPVMLTAANVSLGSAFGDGGELGAALSNTVVLDMYDRAYAVDLSPTVRASSPGLGLVYRLALQNHRSAGTLGNDKAALSFAGVRVPEAAVWNRLGMADDTLAFQRQPGADGWLSLNLAQGRRLAFGYGRSAEDLLSAVGGESEAEMPFLSYGSRVGESLGVAAEPPVTTAASVPLGQWRWSMAASRTELDRGDRASPLVADGRARINTLKSLLTRPMTWGELGLSFGWMEETGSVLGARSAGAFGFKAGARTASMGLSALIDLGPRWSLAADAAMGRTRLDTAQGALLTPDGDVWTSSWKFSLTGNDVWRPGDSFGFLLAQPLRVEKAMANIALPAAYSYDSGVTAYRSTRVNLAPTGREIDLEAVYALPLAERANMAVHGFHRFDAGHGAAGQDDTGLVLRFTLRR